VRNQITCPEDHRVTVIVNGQRREVEGEQLSYEQVVRLAFPNVDPNTAYTVTYDKGPKENREGAWTRATKSAYKTEWCSMSAQLVSLIPISKRLRDEGYEV